MSRDRDDYRGASTDRDDRGGGDYRRERRPESYRMFVGNLPQDIRERELDDLFYKYGKINHISIKNHKEGVPAFAFVNFDSYAALDDAIYYRDGYRFDGRRIRCEKTRDREDRRDRRDDRRDDRRGGRDDRGRGRDRERKPRERKPREPKAPLPRTEFGVLVTGLKENTKWQSLKALFRPVGASLCYANIEPDGSAIVEFTVKDDAEAVAEKFDGQEHEGEIISVRVAGPGECGEGVGVGPKVRQPRENKGPADAPKDALIDDGESADRGGDVDGDKEAAPADTDADAEVKNEADTAEEA